MTVKKIVEILKTFPEDSTVELVVDHNLNYNLEIESVGILKTSPDNGKDKVIIVAEE